LCPAFAFGQTDCFHYWRLGPPLFPKAVVNFVARKIGFAPMLLWGKFGTTVPFDTPVTLAMGDPIVLPQIDEPTKEDCQKYLDIFIADLTTVFYKHREEAGYPELELVIM
jgi:diacylglycerol O-acyltransferase 2, plant